ncbi:MAG: hypothetical protein JWP20_1673 [Roseomonas sp.]|nr:hypothetical protein [Roseomonas sp.]
MTLRLIYLLHLLGAVIWVGGMAFSVLALRPAVGVLGVPERMALLSSVFRRFFLLVWHAMPVLIATGYAMLFGWYGGFAGAGWHIHVMHLTGLVMAGIFLTLFFGPWKAMRAALAAGDNPVAAQASARVRRLLAINLVLGLATVLVAGWGRYGV